jgi:hypothetical protein
VVSADAAAAMKAAVARSKRASSVQFPVEFVRSTGDEPPILAQLMAGGQGGSVRLKLYLTLAMQATRPPRTVVPRTSAGYARLLDLPEDTGSRRVNEALKWLDRRNLIDRSSRPGKPAQITLLHPDGSGEEWTTTGGPRWVTLPIKLWEAGWIFDLSSRSLAVYVALRELVGGSKHPDGQFMDGFRKRQYGMSDDTWTRATKELEQQGLLAITIEPWGDDERMRRVRRRYLLTDLSVLPSRI